MLRFFRRQKTNPAVQKLYADAVAQARQPVFYQTFGVPDTLDGRFDMVVFHVWPLIDALRTESGAISEDGQALFDTFVSDMEQNLRTLGVGDTAVPKKMKAMGRAFYGRFDVYCRVWNDPPGLAEALARNILENEELRGSPEAVALAAYGAAMRRNAGGALPAPVIAEELLGIPFPFPDPARFAPGNGDDAAGDEAAGEDAAGEKAAGEGAGSIKA